MKYRQLVELINRAEQAGENILDMDICIHVPDSSGTRVDYAGLENDMFYCVDNQHAPGTGYPYLVAEFDSGGALPISK